MTALSTRQHRLIDLLLERQQDITVAHIADSLGISPRTVHRELTSVEQYLAPLGIKLHKKSGSGIRIVATDQQLALLQQQFNSKRPADMDAEERKISVLCILLQQQQPIKLFTLAHELNVTMPTVGYDLDDLEATISAHQLQLVRRRGYGVELKGHELYKRKLIATLVSSYLDDSQLISYAHSSDMALPITNQLLRMVGKQTFQRIEEVLWSMQEKLPKPLMESTYTELLLQISIAITRFSNGHPLPKQRQHNEAAFEETITEETITRQIIAMLSIELPSEEKLYLEHLLKQAFQQDQELDLYVNQPDLTEIVTELSRYVEQHTREPVTEDRSLSEGLIKHMLPAIARINEGLAIRNPMLSQIKKDYAHLFGIITEQIHKLMPQIRIPEEEIGYITMHYGAAIERLKQLPKQLKVVIVCTSGIGSSKLLAIRLAKEFPQIEQLGHYSWYEAARLPRSNYDFIISTVDLPLEPNQYIRISPLITDEEIVKLKQYIKQYVQLAPAAPALHKENAGQWFQQLQHISQAALQIINPFDIYSYTVQDESSTIHQLLPELLLSLKSRQDRILNVGAVAQQLLLREEHGSIVLPDTTIAMLHTRHEAVAAPVLALFRFNMPIQLRVDDDINVQHILLMLAPRQLDKYSLEILSEISAMLLLPELTELLQRAETSQIKSFISTQLEKHIKQKLNWRD